jgi:hypothetical protein
MIWGMEMKGNLKDEGYWGSGTASMRREISEWRVIKSENSEVV